MILLVDVGNTRIKWAYVENDIFSYGGASRYTEDKLMDLLSAVWLELPHIEKVFVASVARKKITNLLSQWLKKNNHPPCQLLNTQSSFDKLRNAYQKPQQLGVDRWMALVASYDQHRAPFVIFDCGTAITVDAVDVTNQHIGGLIIPGVELMQQSLTKNTADCKRQAMPTKKVDSLLASNTYQAMSGGALYAIVAFIERLTEELQQALGKNLTCLISGGDAVVLVPFLSKAFIHKPNLVLQGIDVSVKSKQSEKK